MALFLGSTRQADFFSRIPLSSGEGNRESIMFRARVHNSLNPGSQVGKNLAPSFDVLLDFVLLQILRILANGIRFCWRARKRKPNK